MTKYSNDWSGWTDDEVSKKINGFIENRKTYDINITDNGNNIYLYVTNNGAYGIAGDLKIKFGTVGRKKNDKENIVTINGKTVYQNKTPDLYENIKFLYDWCSRSKMSFKEKAKNSLYKNKEILYVLALAACVFGVFGLYGGIVQDATKHQDKQNVKELLKQYELERNKSDMVNIDSLINVHMR